MFLARGEIEKITKGDLSDEPDFGDGPSPDGRASWREWRGPIVVVATMF